MKTRHTEKEVGRQHQGMDRPGVRKVPESSGEQGFGFILFDFIHLGVDWGRLLPFLVTHDLS